MSLPRKSRPRCACGRSTCSAFIAGQPVCASCATRALKSRLVAATAPHSLACGCADCQLARVRDGHTDGWPR